jgi:hypothetical protein
MGGTSFLIFRDGDFDRMGFDCSGVALMALSFERARIRTYEQSNFFFFFGPFAVQAGEKYEVV